MVKFRVTRLFWNIDSEFLSAGKIGEVTGIQMIQIGHLKAPETIPIFDSADTLKEWLRKEYGIWILECPDDLKDWLVAHRYVCDLYAFVLLPDIASVKAWLCPRAESFKDCPYVGVRKFSGLTIGQIKFAGAKINVWDTQPLLKTLGFRKLVDCGGVAGIAKRERPSWLGERGWLNDEEHQELIRYAAFDPVITGRMAKWLVEKIGGDPRKHASMATLTKEIFHFPKRLPAKPSWNRLSPLERLVACNCPAGRNEANVIGLSRNAFYNDIASQYPVSLARIRAFQIVGAEQCDFSDVVVSQDLNEIRFGWLEGVFESDNDVWGLPLRGKNNFYATGRVSGVFHSFDLAAAKARIVFVNRAWKPIFKDDNVEHNKYVDLLLKKLEGKLDSIRKARTKGLLNTAYGKLIQSHPTIARTSNFFAGSSTLGFSHFLLSRLIDKCQSLVLGMDTDSIFSQSNMAGKYWELEDAYGNHEGEHSIPVLMDVKARGDLVYFRAKKYLMKGEDGFFGGYFKDKNGILKKSRGLVVVTAGSILLKIFSDCLTVNWIVLLPGGM